MTRFQYLIIFLFAIQITFAQSDVISPQNVKINSPTAASLGKVADIPVNYHTGIPSIDIPIYSIAAGPLSMPISLSYHASGLKVAEQSSWVGAGWSLNAGGMITRSVRGNADDRTGTSYTTSYLGGNGGFYDYMFDQTNQPDWRTFGQGQQDGEPDLYFFNFNGYSGKFYFRADKSVAILPQQDIRIVPFYADGNYSTSNHELIGWTVTTPDGNKYSFGKTTLAAGPAAYERTLTRSLLYPYDVSYNPIASWYLFKVQSADQQFTIDLTYTSESYGFFGLSLFPYSPPNGGTINGMTVVKNVIDGIRLNTINFPTGTVTFVPSAAARQDLANGISEGIDHDNTNAKSLGSIQISSGSFCKTFDLSYSYFVDNNPLVGSYAGIDIVGGNFHTDQKKLKLNSVTERSCDGLTVKPPHSFAYFDETSVPRALSLAQDHWGYFNGATGNTSLMPPYSLDGGATFTTGANREASWPSMRAGALQSITYPTGGVTEFDYEAHGNGYIRQYNTYVKGTNLVDQNAGFGGGSYESPHSSQTLAGGKYFVDTDGTSLNTGSPNQSGLFHIGSITYNITYGQSTSKVVDIPAGTYDIYTSVSSPLASGKGGIARLYVANVVPHADPTVIGGLRIANINYRNDLNAPIVKHFDYNNGGAQGVLFSRPNYVSIARNNYFANNYLAGLRPPSDQQHNYADTTVNANGCIYTNATGSPVAYSYFISPASIHPMQTTQGNAIGYNKVVVTQGDGGYSVYSYYPQVDPLTELSNYIVDITKCPLSLPNYPPSPDQPVFQRGELVGTKVYSASSVLLKDTQFESVWVTEPTGVNGLTVRTMGARFMATMYEIKTARRSKTTELDLIYNGAATPMTTISETFFNNPDHNLATQSVTSEVSSGTTIATAVKGKVLSDTRNTYVADFSIQSCVGTVTFDFQLSQDLNTANTNWQSTKGGCSTYNCQFNGWLTYLAAVNTAWKTYRNSRAAFYSNYATCMASTSNYSASTTDVKALINLKNRYQISAPIESSKWRNGNLIGSAFLTYQDALSNSINIYPYKLDKVTVATPSPTFTTLFMNTSITRDSRYQTEETYSFSGGNLVQTVPKSGLVSSYIWNASQQYPIAEIKNAASGTSAYTSFEEAASEGGWSFTYSNYSSDAKTGAKSHSLSGNDVSRSGLNAGTVYTVSYWAKGGTPTISNGVTANNDAPTADADGWRYYEKIFTGTTAIIISGVAGVYLDELRIYPQGSQMSTYAYKPLIGMISSTDPNNRHGYFDYDGLGRLILLKDVNRNILKQMKYNYRTTISGQ